MSVAQITAREEASKALTTKKAKAAAKAPKATCGQLRAEEDRIRKRREALEEKNKDRRKVAQEKLEKRQKSEHTKMEARHAKELAELNDKYGCVPKPRKKGKKGGAKRGKRAKAGADDATPSPPRQPPPAPTRPRQDVPVGTDAPAGVPSFEQSTATVAEVLRAAYDRKRALPWQPLAEPSTDTDLNERKAWIGVLSEPYDFDNEARYMSGTAIRYLAANEAERATYPRSHVFYLNYTRPAEIALAASEVGFKVDKQILKDAKATLERAQARMKDTSPVKPEPWALRTLQRFHALVTAKRARAKKPARKPSTKSKTAAEPAAPAPQVGVFTGADAPPFKTWSAPTPAPLALAPVFTEAELQDLLRKIRAGTVGLEEYQDGFRRLLDSKAALFALWESQSKQALFPKNAAADLARYTKPQLIARKWDNWIRVFLLPDDPAMSYVFIPGQSRDPAENIRALVEQTTPASLATYNARMQVYRAGQIAEVERRRARMTDPQTLDDYQLLVTARGEGNLTPEQRIRYDELRAEATLEREAAERGSTARSITVPDVGKSWDIVATYHFRRGVPTWTVQKSTKGRDIPPDEFKRLNSAARALGGGWERFAKVEHAAGQPERRAVPGFLFWTREAAEKFLSALGGETVDNAAEVAAREARAADQRAARREYLGCCKGVAPRESPIAAAERGLVGRTFPGYFPTPRGLAAELVEAADIRAGHRVLEPSAGKGDIAAAIQAAAPASELVTIELQPALTELLKDKGFTVSGRDFLEETPATLGTFDRIVANPPFEESADIEHVRHMWSFLRPGGRIVTIMSEGPFFRQDKKAAEFRAWLEKQGGTSSKNPEGSFLASDRPTGVPTRTVILERRKK